MIGVDHGSKKAARRLVRTGTELTEHAGNALSLQACGLERQRLAFRRDEQQALPAILRAFLLNHVTLVDQLLEHAAERLLCNIEDLQEVGDLHAWIAVDKMQHPVMSTAEAELGQHLVRIADEVTIGKEQEFDDVPDRLRRRGRGGLALGNNVPRRYHLGTGIYVSHVDIF